MGVAVGEQPALEHLVRRRSDAGYEVARVEAGLLDVAEVVVGVAVEREPAHLVEGVLLLRPHLGQVEGVDPVGRGLFERS